ncbi:hypothetical protein CR513_46594, partial [Mucuna pruriens]
MKDYGGRLFFMTSKLLYDNNSTINIKNWKSGLIVTTHVPIGFQVAHVFTKGLPTYRFQELNDKLGIINIHLPT